MPPLRLRQGPRARRPVAPPHLRRGLRRRPLRRRLPPRGAAPEPVVLGDIAEVREVPSDLAGISRTNGEPSLGLNIVKETDANTVEVAEEIEGVLDDARDELGEDQVVVVSNAAVDVEESVSGLVEEAIVGAVLAILVIFAFLRSLRATLVTAVSPYRPRSWPPSCSPGATI